MEGAFKQERKYSNMNPTGLCENAFKQEELKRFEQKGTLMD